MKFDKFYYYDEIDSTQKEIWRRIDKKNISSGTVIVAQKQTKGIGTHGRKWHTDEENNIAFSFYVSFNQHVKSIDGLTVEIAEVLLEVFEELYGIKLDIKIPNDIVFNNKKIGGILTESKLVGEILKDLVVGIGINTNQLDFAEEICDIATSIKREFEIDVNNELVIKEFFKRFKIKLEKRMGDN